MRRLLFRMELFWTPIILFPLRKLSLSCSPSGTGIWWYIFCTSHTITKRSPATVSTCASMSGMDLNFLTKLLLIVCSVVHTEPSSAIWHWRYRDHWPPGVGRCSNIPSCSICTTHLSWLPVFVDWCSTEVYLPVVFQEERDCASSIVHMPSSCGLNENTVWYFLHKSSTCELCCGEYVAFSNTFFQCYWQFSTCLRYVFVISSNPAHRCRQHCFNWRNIP